ncbi:MAG: hypothetical protein E5299_02003 [Burkholderia gladioli]|nr:MAG: hypothetical protein E5299_02003 [Burkholderia gladioli]
MTHQNVADGDALAKLPDQIPREEPIDVICGDGAYDTKLSKAMPCGLLLHAVLFLRFHPEKMCRSWASGYASGVWRNSVVDAIAYDGRREWKKESGYHRRSLDEAIA